MISWYRTTRTWPITSCNIDFIFTPKFFGLPDTPLSHSFCIADGSPNNQQLWGDGFFIVGEKQSHCRSISIARDVHGSVFPRKHACCHTRCEERLAERERDPSGCRASGLTSELQVHVVLVPTPSPAMVVRKKLRILLVPATALSTGRFFSYFFAEPEAYRRGRISDGYIAMKLKMKKMKWSWAGHINRLNDDRWTSRVTTWRP